LNLGVDDKRSPFALQMSAERQLSTDENQKKRMALFPGRSLQYPLALKCCGGFLWRWGASCPVYRFYIFEKDNHAAAPPRIYDLPNDAAALEAARTINGSTVEIWCHTKKIGRFNPHGQSPGDVRFRG
jgi:hypothetical protein